MSTVGTESAVRAELGTSRRLVIKVGSQVLCHDDGTLDLAVVTALCAGVAARLQAGQEVALVSSGAVASGTGATPSLTLGKQALAAIGQPLLMARYRELFAVHGIVVAQVLLTHADLADRGRFLHARRVMAELMAAGVLPIVNENDTVAVEELKFGDNDALAAQVAHVVGADTLVLLTETDGLYTTNPHEDPTATRIAAGASQDDALLGLASGGKSQFGTGGMLSKLQAARKAGSVGVTVAIARGKNPQVLQDLFAGADVGTVLSAGPKRLTGKRAWMATSLRTRGTVHVDAGAAQALHRGGRSLLPIGVQRVEGTFQVGDPLLVVGPDGNAVGRGLARYDSADAHKVVGLRTEQITLALGWLPAQELIHRDDFVPA